VTPVIRPEAPPSSEADQQQQQASARTGRVGRPTTHGMTKDERKAAEELQELAAHKGKHSSLYCV